LPNGIAKDAGIAQRGWRIAVMTSAG
jgi:hypothetical protein